jgi:hypothetical protein
VEHRPGRSVGRESVVNTPTSFGANELRALLTDFWNGILEVQTTHQGLLFTMPVSYPDGWQVVLQLQRIAPNTWRLTDRGQALHLVDRPRPELANRLHANSSEKALWRAFPCNCSEGVLSRHLTWPIEASEIHVFAEGVAAISRLDFFNEHRAIEEDVASQAVQRTLHDAHLPYQRHHKLSITADRSVAVDFYVVQKRPAAIQILKTKTDLPGTMEKWGFRWRELKGLNPSLAPIMLFDRNTQTVDSYSRHIAQAECELFCGFDETDRIHSTLRALQ